MSHYSGPRAGIDAIQDMASTRRFLVSADNARARNETLQFIFEDVI